MALYQRLTLTTRLVLVALLAMIPLAALVVALQLEERQIRRDAALGEATSFAQEVATGLETFATEIESFMDAAAIVIGQSDISQAGTSAYLESLASRHPSLQAVFVVDPHGMLSASSSARGGFGRELGDRPYVTEVSNGKEAAWTQAFAGQDSGAVLATFTRTIRSPDGDLEGYLVASFQPADLNETFRELIEANDNLFLVDSAGQVAYTTHQDDSTLLGLANDPLVATALGGQVARLEDQETRLSPGARYGAVAPVSRMGWAVGFTKPMSSLDSTLWWDLVRNFGVLALIMAVVVVALMLFAHQVTHPLRMLADSAARLREGAEPDLAKIPRADPHVRKLEESFADMSFAVRQREDLLRQQAERLGELEEAGATIASGLDYEQTVQAVTDAGRSLTGARYAAFYHRRGEASDEEYVPYTLSGFLAATEAAMRDARNAPIFRPSSGGRGTFRLDDATQEPRLAGRPPFQSLSPPVRSYMAVSVRSSDGEILGGLFFGHEEPGVFTQHHETLALRVATWASIALDNARLYREAREIQEELRLANIAKDEFLGLVSHELRTPITTIHGGLRLMVTHRELMQGEQADELIETMAEESSRLIRLIEDLLALTRMQLGKTIDLSPARLDVLVNDAIHDFHQPSTTRDIQVQAPSGLPLVALEPTYFKQVLTNLLSNADKYSPASEPIEVNVEQQGDHVTIQVADHGPGIGASELDKIFDSFYRSDKTTGLATGQGLGLTVCRTLVKAQQGDIWVENREDGGLAVSVSFPVYQPADRSATPASEGVLP